MSLSEQRVAFRVLFEGGRGIRACACVVLVVGEQINKLRGDVRLRLLTNEEYSYVYDAPLFVRAYNLCCTGMDCKRCALKRWEYGER